ncbi:hypothetical protein ACWEO2_23080 [Nocardia sp. NPDC004278]
MFDRIESTVRLDRGIAGITAGVLLGAATLLHTPPARADNTGSAAQPQGALFGLLTGEPAGRTPALGFAGPEAAIVGLGYGLLPDGTMRPELISRLHAGYVQALLAPAIEFRGRVTSLDPYRHTATIALDAKSHGRRLFGYAAAEVRFPVTD